MLNQIRVATDATVELVARVAGKRGFVCISKKDGTDGLV